MFQFVSIFHLQYYFLFSTQIHNYSARFTQDSIGSLFANL